MAPFGPGRRVDGDARRRRGRQEWKAEARRPAVSAAIGRVVNLSLTRDSAPAAAQHLAPDRLSTTMTTPAPLPASSDLLDETLAQALWESEAR
jgi:hypothetical protein